MFDLERFIEESRSALAQGQPAVREVVARAMRDPASVLRAVGEPTRSGLNVLHHSADLTVLNIVWAPMMTIMPHNHGVWAVIGLYSGREDNIFWRRIDEPGKPTRIEAAGAKALSTGEAAPLGRDIIHSVTNPIPRLTGAIHVYGGDFFALGRSEWDPENLLEGPYDSAKTKAMFEDANARR